jgi:hypothetical protein
MYKKHLEHIAIVSLKFFLNLDHDLSDHVVRMALFILSCIKLLFAELLFGANAAWLRAGTVAIALKASITNKDKTAENARLLFSGKLFKNFFLQRDNWHWRNKPV